MPRNSSAAASSMDADPFSTSGLDGIGCLPDGCGREGRSLRGRFLPNARGFTLVELMVVIAIIAIISGLLVPNLMVSSRTANERNASMSLRNIAGAQATFRSMDADQNGVSDFWTADVAGLYYISPGSATRKTITAKDGSSTSGSTGQNQNPPVGLGGIRLIDRSVCRADADTATEGDPNGYDLTHACNTKSGYWYMVLRDFQTADGRENSYGVRNTEKFGLAAYPHAHGSSGSQVFLVTETGQVIRRDPGSPEYWASGPPPYNIPQTDGEATDDYDTYPAIPPGPGTPSVVAGPWSFLD